MKKGFIFDMSLCINCKACNAACSVENKFSVKARNVLTYNLEAAASAPLSNLSIACNHCEIPVCMNGCPASAYRFDPLSEALIVDEAKCIGCKYCIWNCPFDAPKYDPENRVIGKCNLCYSRLEEGLEPACTSGCPTGALRFGEIEELKPTAVPDWFPGKELSPAFRFIGDLTGIPLRIIPASLFRNEMKPVTIENKSKGSGWSLILFSYFALLSVSFMSASLINNKLPEKYFFTLITILPGFFSLFHLGKWYRAWRAVFNLKNSPLSREIVIYISYLILSMTAIEYQIPWLLITASVAGISLLVAIDAVYFYSIRRMAPYLHSGQTFFSALLLISFLTDSEVSFIFMAIIKTGLTFYRYRQDLGTISILRFIRLALLLVAVASMVSGISYPGTTVLIIVLTGEFIDRILFYEDFEPVGINNLIIKHLSEKKYETQGD